MISSCAISKVPSKRREDMLRYMLDTFPESIETKDETDGSTILVVIFFCSLHQIMAGLTESGPSAGFSGQHEREGYPAITKLHNTVDHGKRGRLIGPTNLSCACVDVPQLFEISVQCSHYGNSDGSEALLSQY